MLTFIISFALSYLIIDNALLRDKLYKNTIYKELYKEKIKEELIKERKDKYEN